MKVEIYSDGSCLGNPGPGGYASLVMYRESKFWITGNESHTTNNQMELLALIKALEFLDEENLSIESISVYTDSKYVQLGISQWIYKWIQNDWKRKGNRILNIELWNRLLILKNKYPFNIYWVKAHEDNILNNLVDQRARVMAQQVKGN